MRGAWDALSKGRTNHAVRRYCGKPAKVRSARTSIPDEELARAWHVPAGAFNREGRMDSGDESARASNHGDVGGSSRGKMGRSENLNVAPVEPQEELPPAGELIEFRIEQAQEDLVG